MAFHVLFQTDKTMAELEIDINMRIREWDVIQVGRQLRFIFLHCMLRALLVQFPNVSHNAATFISRLLSPYHWRQIKQNLNLDKPFHM